MKKIGVLFTVIIVAMLFAVSASANVQTTEDGFLYIVNNGEVTIGYRDNFDYDNPEFVDLVIPSEIDGYPVTEISRLAFKNCDGITSITIPDSVTTIGEEAFVGCPYLQFIKVDENNEYFSNDEYGVLFNKDKTKLICYPGGFNTTEHLLVQWAKGRKYIIPQGVETIGSFAFYSNNYGLEVIIPDSVTTIELGAFCQVFLRNLVIPGSVKRIGYGAFINSRISALTICEGVEVIEKAAFGENEIGNIMLPKSLKKIEESGFSFSVGNWWDGEKNVNVFYSGSEEQWSEIEIEYGNESIIETSRHYNYSCDSHEYTSEILYEPLCDDAGFVEYTCDCGWFYMDVCFDLDNHDMSDWSVDTPATCAAAGVESRHCQRKWCHSKYVETRELPIKSHTMSNWVTDVAPTCTVDGSQYRKCTVCGGAYESKKISATHHKDNNQDNFCDNCNESIDTSGCSCNCHKSGFMGFIWKITLFFIKLFKSNRVCVCGVGHY